jgi:fucose 4-O-acetylase-like acetyltransferase
VFGHLLELFVSSKGTLLYLLIYSFHMPAFVFLTGYYARFEPKKIVLKLIVPYIIFQVWYVYFSGNRLQFTPPYWILWYLFAVIIWKLLLPLCEKKLKLSLIIAVIIALLAGFDDTIGYYLSLSRIIVFFPFFLLGNLLSKEPDKLESLHRQKCSEGTVGSWSCRSCGCDFPAAGQHTKRLVFTARFPIP